MKYIDLHTHTTSSDGTYTPQALINYALSKNLSAIAITDHDTIEAIRPARLHLGQSNALEIISGIEFSTNSEAFKSDIHILGLYINENDLNFVQQLDEIVHSRNLRNQKMVDKLCEIGLPLTIEDVYKNATDGVITRAHFGKALLEKGYVKKLNDAFKKYIGNDCVAYVPREKLSPSDAIGMIKACGGIAVLAHPTLYKMSLKELDPLIENLMHSGLQGIEGYYPLYNALETAAIQAYAKKYHLILTGGSDFHGSNKPDIDLAVGKGNLKIPYELLEPINKLLLH